MPLAICLKSCSEGEVSVANFESKQLADASLADGDVMIATRYIVSIYPEIRAEWKRFDASWRVKLRCSRM